MSSLPASPNPQKSRAFTLGRRVRSALAAGSRAPAAIHEDTAEGTLASPAAPAGSTASPAASATAAPAPEAQAPATIEGRSGPSAVPASVTVPAAPGSSPAPALPARIPYSEWKGPRPLTVRLGFALIMLAGFISLGGGVAASRRPLTELPPDAAQLGQLGVTAAEYSTAMQAITLATSLVVFGLYVLFAFTIREGRNWARIGASIIAAAALVLALREDSTPQIAALLLAAAGLVPLYGRRCSRYFRPRRSQYLGES
ncbi:hypothetical protein ACIQXM_15820 [Arthrobacter sp. NPDC097144]|uniref:hypothetical protein n=1 Tax=Arthrobacter sp. NPDC097144 TaxID=3363946 RepID=UPI0038105D7C